MLSDKLSTENIKAAIQKASANLDEEQKSRVNESLEYYYEAITRIATNAGNEVQQGKSSGEYTISNKRFLWSIERNKSQLSIYRTSNHDRGHDIHPLREVVTLLEGKLVEWAKSQGLCGLVKAKSSGSEEYCEFCVDFDLRLLGEVE